MIHLSLAQSISEWLQAVFYYGSVAGGAPIGLPVQEYFAVKGIPTDHILVRTSSYSGIDNQSRDVRIFGLSYLVKRLSLPTTEC